MKNIFGIQTEQDFLAASLETFRYQYENIEVYRRFVDYLNIEPDHVDQLSKIPFLPIEMFKNHRVLDKNAATDLFFKAPELHR